MKQKSILIGLCAGLAILLAVIPGCRCNNHTPTAISDTADTADLEKNDSFSMEGLSQKDSAKILANAPVTQALQKVMPQAPDWKRFKLVDFNHELDSSQTVGFHPEPSFFAKYATFLKASPDKKYWIDMGTDNIVEDPATHTMMSGDPEGKIFLIDRKAGTRAEIVNLGGSGNLLGSNWLDGDEVSILCTLPGRDPKKDETYLYIYNVRTHLIRTYELK